MCKNMSQRIMYPGLKILHLYLVLLTLDKLLTAFNS